MTEFSEKKNNNYNLEERTALFSELLVRALKKIRKDSINNPMISQLIRSGTSIGANYCEANNASSKRDFRNKIYICKKETSETKYWLRILSNANLEFKEDGRKIWKEAHELNMIFQKIVNTLNKI